MKKTIITSLILFSCSLHAGELLITKKSLINPNYTALETLKPQHLVDDFNGDNKKDISFFIKNKKTNKKGICIIHSGSNSCVILGAGIKFYAGGDDFSWVDTWETIPKGETWERTFTPENELLGEKKVHLLNASIRICVEEGGCGVITYRKGKYHWVHQGD